VFNIIFVGFGRFESFHYLQVFPNIEWMDSSIPRTKQWHDCFRDRKQQTGQTGYYLFL